MSMNIGLVGKTVALTAAILTGSNLINGNERTAALDGKQIVKNEKDSTIVKEVTDITFEKEVLKSKLPVLIDFWAPWCGPCRRIAPEVEAVAKQYNGKVKVVRINTDENREIIGKYNIKSIPTLMLFKNGENINRIVGYHSRNDISKFVNQNLKSKS